MLQTGGFGQFAARRFQSELVLSQSQENSRLGYAGFAALLGAPAREIFYRFASARRLSGPQDQRELPGLRKPPVSPRSATSRQWPATLEGAASTTMRHSPSRHSAVYRPRPSRIAGVAISSARNRRTSPKCDARQRVVCFRRFSFPGGINAEDRVDRLSFHLSA